MSTIGIIILIFYILGCILSFWFLASNAREHNDYLTLSECARMSFLSIFSWIVIISMYIAIYGDKPFIKFKK
jgi:hypothetical protein